MKITLSVIVLFALYPLVLAQEKAPPHNRYTALEWYKSQGIEPPQDLTSLPTQTGKNSYSARLDKGHRCEYIFSEMGLR